MKAEGTIWLIISKLPLFKSFKDELFDTNIIWTKNKSNVFIIKEYIVHDMYLIDVEENLVEQMKYIYGKGFKRLKDKVLGTNSLYMIH